MSVESNNQKSSDHRFHAGSVFQHESDIIIDSIIKNGCNCCWFLSHFLKSWMHYCIVSIGICNQK